MTYYKLKIGNTFESHLAALEVVHVVVPVAVVRV